MKFVPVLSPLVPAVRVLPAQVKPVPFARVGEVPMVLPPVPAVTAVTVTLLVSLEAVTFAPEQALIAVLRFKARVDVSELVAKVAVDTVGHAFEPFVPAVVEVWEKPEAVPPSVTLKSDPGVV